MNKPSYPIRVVADRTGLKPDLIRMWERRYQAVQPDRTPTGHRLYTDREIERLVLLKKTLDCGWRIGDVSSRPNQELEALVAKHDQSRSKGADLAQKMGLSKNNHHDYLNQCLQTVATLDLERLSSLLESAERSLGFPEVLDILVSPLLSEIGLRWERGEFTLSQEHLVSATLRRYLDTVRTRERAGANAFTLLSTTPSGQNHELGALMTAATAAVSGWNSIYMNPSTPAADIAWSANALKAKVVALSIVYPARDGLLISELQHLSRLLSTGTYILIGGSSADFYQPIQQYTDKCVILSSQLDVQGFLNLVHKGIEPETVGN